MEGTEGRKKTGSHGLWNPPRAESRPHSLILQRRQLRPKKQRKREQSAGSLPHHSRWDSPSRSASVSAELEEAVRKL